MKPNDMGRDSYPEMRERIARPAEQQAQHTWEAQRAWKMEAVKHLSTINIAGLAGAAALLTFRTGDLVLEWSFVLFTLGLVLSIIDFWLNSQGYWLRGMGDNQRIIDIRKAQNYEAFFKTSAIESTTGQDWLEAALRVGWLSAVMAIAGVALLAISLWTGG